MEDERIRMRPLSYARLAEISASLLLIATAMLGVSFYKRKSPADPDLAAGALEVLERRQAAPLSGPLQQILANYPLLQIRTQEHPLVDRAARDFALPDHEGRSFRLSDQWRKGPVVLVFYYGYFCDHCVAQLFALNADLKYFHELGAEVVAVSPDPPELTRRRFEEYAAKGGRFAFPVLADVDHAAATLYGAFQAYRPAEKNRSAQDEIALHGTFLIDRGGVVRWADLGPTPFTNNKALLCELARLQQRLPPPPPRRTESVPATLDGASRPSAR